MSSMSTAADAATVGKTPARRGWSAARYAVPTSLTLGSVLCGWYAIICSYRAGLAFTDTRRAASLFVYATMATGLAIVLDNLDGRIARIIGATSKFGGELDSLADVLTFGMAAAILAYVSSYGAIAEWQTSAFILSFVFIAAGAIRLARSNVLSHDERHFIGLPIPAAAGGVAAAVHFYYSPLVASGQLPNFRSFALVMVGLVIVLSLLMVSTFPYSKLKLARTQIGFAFPAIAIAVTFGMLFESRWPVLIIAFLYVTHGPVLWAVRATRAR